RTMATPANPVRQGFIFEGWYEDSYCLIKAEFGAKKSMFKITAPTDFYAKWTVDTSADPEPQPEDPEHPQDPEDPEQPQQPLPDCDYHVDSDGDGKCDKCGRDMPSYEDTFGTIYLDATKFDWWGSDGAVINMHVWYVDGTNNNWPGAKMTLNQDGLYEAQYYTSRVVKGIIFTRNDPNPNPNEGIPTEWDRVEIGELDFNPAKPVYRLKMYSHQGETTTFQGKWLALGEEDVADIVGDDKVYLDFRDIDWFADAGAKLYAYIWYADGSQNADYPGKEMTFTTGYTEVHYSAYVDCSAIRGIAGIIFTRNNPALTPGSDEAVWNKLEMSTELGNLGWAASTPALRLTAVNGNSFEGTWESEEAATSSQAVVIEPQPEEPQPETPWDGTVTVDLSDVTWFEDNGCLAYLYVWYADGSFNATYPGAKMTKGTGGLWAYRTDATKSVSGMIVIRVSADEATMYNKSGDITVIPSNHLVRVEQSDMSEIPEDQRTISDEPIAADPDWDGTITFSITWEYFGTADAYLYVWYTDGAPVAFPGVKMNQDGSGNYVGKIDTSKTLVGLIVARCNPETGEKWNQSGDITSIPTSHHITIEWMN
ncbi:MAG: InlB B-repeat-containing protein, partial [Clostridia bacterium]|nr:InlB B-repeat-containing protein [Clostridia bacterium]